MAKDKKKLGRFILAALIVLLILCTISFHFIAKKSFAYLKENLASNNSAFLKEEKISVGLLGNIKLISPELITTINNFPVSLACKDGYIEWNKFPLTQLTLKLNGIFNCYSGVVKMDFSSFFMGTTLKFFSLIKNISLENHPLLRASGLRGALSAVIKGQIDGENDNKDNLSLNAKLHNLQFNGQLFANFGFTFPTIQNGEIKIKAKKIGRKINLIEFKTVSSLGETGCSGNGNLNAWQTMETYQVSCLISLSEQGVQSFGDYMKLFSGIDYSSPTPLSWIFQTSKSNASDQPSISLTPNL